MSDAGPRERFLAGAFVPEKLKSEAICLNRRT